MSVCFLCFIKISISEKLQKNFHFCRDLETAGGVKHLIQPLKTKEVVVFRELLASLASSSAAAQCSSGVLKFLRRLPLWQVYGKASGLVAVDSEPPVHMLPEGVVDPIFFPEVFLKTSRQDRVLLTMIDCPAVSQYLSRIGGLVWYLPLSAI